jgi:hypothetical protein
MRAPSSDAYLVTGGITRRYVVPRGNAFAATSTRAIRIAWSPMQRTIEHHSFMFPTALVAGVALLASVASVTPADATRPTALASLNCRDPIGSAATPPPSVHTIGEAVALQTSTSTRRALQTARFADAPGFRYFTKTPVYVRTNGKSATISVPRRQQGRIAMSWGNTDSDGVATQSFTVGPCSATTNWIVFPGGYHITRPGCFRLVVRVAGNDERVEVGLGAPCPGQRPPP